MPQDRLTFLEFCRLVLDTLDATDIEWLIGGALATWAWGGSANHQSPIFLLRRNRRQPLTSMHPDRHIIVVDQLIHGRAPRAAARVAERVFGQFLA